MTDNTHTRFLGSQVLDALCDLDGQFTHRTRNLAELAVVGVEKAVGFALDAEQRAKAVASVEQHLRESPHFAPDAHLEMEYEERIWGGYHGE